MLFYIFYARTKLKGTIHEFRDIGRVRDLAVGEDGLVYLLLEHAKGSRIVRLVPAEARSSAATVSSAAAP